LGIASPNAFSRRGDPFVSGSSLLGAKGRQAIDARENLAGTGTLRTGVGSAADEASERIA
jgi:hypothetical protein